MASQQRTVPMCEENLVLGHLLGYRYKQIRESGGRTLPENLRHLEKLEGFLMRDLLFVSVDIATGRDFGNSFSADSHCVGISILDTRSLTKPIDTDREAEAAIQSQQFVTQDSGLFAWAARPPGSCHVLTWYVERDDAADRIAWLTRDRKYVLVGSELQRDCKILEQLSPTGWRIAERACFRLDILRAAQYPLQLSHRPSIQCFLEAFGIKCKRLSLPGDYAHFTLKAMLLLAVRDWKMGGDPFTDTGRRLERDLLRVATHKLPSTRSASPQVSWGLPPADATDMKDEQDDEEESWVLMPLAES
ncbi:hypothetical protein V8C44DRAFT_349521 [Trichoderma aethiopicum]